MSVRFWLEIPQRFKAKYPCIKAAQNGINDPGLENIFETNLLNLTSLDLCICLGILAFNHFTSKGIGELAKCLFKKLKGVNLGKIISMKLAITMSARG